jgi:hypothetical protein
MARSTSHIVTTVEHVNILCIIGVRVVGFNATFNNTSVILWWSVLLVEETEVPGINHRPAASHWQTLSHSCIECTSPWTGLELTTLVVICTDCIDSCKYHTITTIATNMYNVILVKKNPHFSKKSSLTCLHANDITKLHCTLKWACLLDTVYARCDLILPWILYKHSKIIPSDTFSHDPLNVVQQEFSYGKTILLTRLST